MGDNEHMNIDLVTLVIQLSSGFYSPLDDHYSPSMIADWMNKIVTATVFNYLLNYQITQISTAYHGRNARCLISMRRTRVSDSMSCKS